MKSSGRTGLFVLFFCLSLFTFFGYHPSGLSFSFARPKEKDEKKKTAWVIRRPTNGSIPKPVEPFGC